MNLNKYVAKLTNQANEVLADALDVVDTIPAIVSLIGKHDNVRGLYVNYRPKVRKFLKLKKPPVRAEVLLEDLDEGGQVAFGIFLKSQ